MSFTLQEEQSRDRVFTAVSKTGDVFDAAELTMSEVFSVLTVLFSTVVQTTGMDIDETVKTLGMMLHEMNKIDITKIRGSIQ